MRNTTRILVDTHVVWNGMEFMLIVAVALSLFRLVLVPLRAHYAERLHCRLRIPLSCVERCDPEQYSFGLHNLGNITWFVPNCLGTPFCG